MKKTAKELAQLCNGMDIDDFPGENENIAKENGLVIVYGESDDLMEFRGAINDEFGCFDGGTARIDKTGLLPEWESLEGE